MAIRVRRGANSAFNPAKMVSGEFAVTTDGTRKVYATFAPNDTAELMKKTDVVNNLTATQAGYALDARQGKAISDALMVQTYKSYNLGGLIVNVAKVGRIVMFNIVGGSADVVQWEPIYTLPEYLQPIVQVDFLDTVENMRVMIGIDGQLKSGSASKNGAVLRGTTTYIAKNSTPL